MDYKLGFIGFGKMAEAIYAGLLTSSTFSKEQIWLNFSFNERAYFFLRDNTYLY